jgi:hypothetical protein
LPTVIVRTSPADLGGWLEHHAASHPLLRRGGFISERILRDADDPDALIVLMEIESIERWRAFLRTPEAQSEIARAPVLRPPTMTLAEELTNGELGTP